jgi:hypothetical protein
MEKYVYPVSGCEQKWIDRIKRAAIVYAAGGSLFILGLFDWMYGLWNDLWLEWWNNNIEGYVPLIALAPEG